jgi:hypothetical protein
VPRETATRKKRRIRSPHPGVVLIKPNPADRHTYWRARFVDPDTGRSSKLRLDPFALPTAEARRSWAILKSKTLASRRMELESGAPRTTGTTLNDAIERYFAAHVRLSARSKLDYGAALNKLVKWAEGAGVQSADELTRPKLISFREQLVNECKRVVVKSPAPRPTKEADRRRAVTAKRGGRQATTRLRAPETVNGELRKVRTVLGYLRRLDLLPRLRDDDLRDALKRLPAAVERIEFLQPHACQQLLEAALRHDAELFAATRAEHRRMHKRDRSAAHAAICGAVSKTGLRLADVDGDVTCTGCRALMSVAARPVATTPRYEPIAPFVAFVLLTGMRLTEALEVEWHQVELDALDGDGRKVGEIHLAGAEVKTKRARTVGLEVSPALRALLAALKLKAGGASSVFGLSDGQADAAAKRIKQTYGAPKTFGWQVLRRTCGTFLTNAPGIFGAASAYRSAKQLGHSVAVAERHYLGLVRGIPREARTLEAAMQIEAVMGRVVAAVGGAPSAVVLVPGPRGRQATSHQ